MKAQAVNTITGEVIELEAGNYQEVMESWRLASELARVAAELKEQLKSLVPLYVGEKGLSEPLNGFMFRLSNVQRYNYDKSVMRLVFDADTFDLLLKPDKPLVDKYLKEHLESLGEGSTKLRDTMIAEGKPYETIRLEKVTR